MARLDDTTPVVEPDEDTTESLEEMLDRICYELVRLGAGSHPPTATAESTIATIQALLDRELSHMDRAKIHGKYDGRLAEALSLIEKFDAQGYDPVARAHRHRCRLRAEGHDIGPMEWDWLEDSPVTVPEELR